jgi:WD40 repeat protein
MNTLKRVISFVTGGSSLSRRGDLELPRFVSKAFVLAKDAGHRGPVLGGYLLKTLDGLNAAVTVTPTGFTVVDSDSGSVICVVKSSPDGTDAFTSVALIPLTSGTQTESCGLVVGTQKGKLLLIQISRESKPKYIAECEIPNPSPVTCVCVSKTDPSIAVAGTVDGRVLVWEPSSHPSTPTVSVQVYASPITCIHISDNLLYVASEGICVFSILRSGSLLTLTRGSVQSLTFDGMQSITSIVESFIHGLLICLSSCSEVFLIDKVSHQLVTRYPASLMTCGAALSSMSGLEISGVPGSTFLVLGAVDGSLCLRELCRRPKDDKLQCVLHKCFDRLTPQHKSVIDLPIDPSEGCPITSVYTPSEEVCVVGDASCSVFVVNMVYQGCNSIDTQAETQDEPINETETATEMSTSKRLSIDEADDNANQCDQSQLIEEDHREPEEGINLEPDQEEKDESQGHGVKSSTE